MKWKHDEWSMQLYIIYNIGYDNIDNLPNTKPCHQSLN